MADSNTIVPLNKCPRVEENSAGKSIPILQAQSWYGGDEWVGTADELIAAGLVARDQLPGEPGNNKVCVTYYRGNLVGKGSNAPHDENYLNIKRYGKHRFIVRVGISIEEEQRRDTKKRLLEKSPDIDFSSLPPALFYIGERVGIEAGDWRGIVKVVEIKYNNDDDYVGYAYMVDSNLSDQYNWFAEKLLYKYTTNPASIIELSSAAPEPVQQTRGPGRLPKSIASFWDAQQKSRLRDKKLKELREKLRSLNWNIDAIQKMLHDEHAYLIEIERQIRDLLR